MRTVIDTTKYWLFKAGYVLYVLLVLLTGSSTLTMTTDEWLFEAYYVTAVIERFLHGLLRNGSSRLVSILRGVFSGR